MQRHPTRGSANDSMPSLLLILLLSLYLASSFCEGRTASFLYSEKDMVKVTVKNPSILTSKTEATAEKTYQVTALGVKSINHRGHRKEDNMIRRENSPNYVQKHNLVAVWQHEQPYSASKEKSGFHLDYEGPRVHTPSHN